MKADYVHGYDELESTRLQDQASTLVELLHADTSYPSGSKVLEAGCGVGSQSVTLGRNSPEAAFTSVDISESSLQEARKRVGKAGLTNITFAQADILDLPYNPQSFDHVFVCFVLEHLQNPVEVLTRLREVLKEGGTMTVIEGDHGSAYFHPDSDAARRAIHCQVELQKRGGGNANIGRELYPILKRAGFSMVSVSPRMVYVDAGRPDWIDGFTKKTFTAMIEGIRGQALQEGLIEADLFDRGIADLYRTMEPDGTFCYTFFKAIGVKGS